MPQLRKIFLFKFLQEMPQIVAGLIHFSLYNNLYSHQLQVFFRNCEKILDFT